MPPTSEIEQFIEALGVKVIEVPDLGGRCATWSESARRVRVCAKLCLREREEIMTELLSGLSLPG